MSCDKLVFDLSQEIEGSPNVFVRKDWLNILDNQNGNYQSNQSIVDTSQLSNSNKWMSYREGYLMIPMVLSVSATSNAIVWNPSTSEFAVGLKNWYGSIIHSFTLDYNGTTIIQQTPFCNMWNSFKLLTSLSWGDVISQGATIGFYPDDPTAFKFYDATYYAGVGGTIGIGTCNNMDEVFPTAIDVNTYENYTSSNTGFTKRQTYINFDPSQGIEQTNAIVVTSTRPYSQLQTTTSCNSLWKSYVFNTLTNAAGKCSCLQIAITGIVYLKHIHSFFNMIPLLKGVFMKMTMNLNNASVGITLDNNKGITFAPAPSVPVGGINPIMIPGGTTITPGMAGGLSSLTATATYIYDLSVGATALSQNIKSIANTQIGIAPLSKSVYLYVPAYTFNPVFEQAYLSSGVKQIKYTDIYQYQVLGIVGNGAGLFNNLITNGIANIKSVLIIPFFSTSGDTTGSNTGMGTTGIGIPVFQSPFDPAGTGLTSPLCHFTNFNVQISGQNAIYNTQRYTFEQFNNQLYGQNAVNGGMVDGLTSGLIDYMGFQMSACYYYVNVERMLPVEQSVPKSIQIMGTSLSQKTLDLWVFVEYGVEINIDPITGARV